MKHINLLILFLTFLSGNLFAQNKDNIIRDIQVQSDFVENGVKGLRISLTCDYGVLRKKYDSDSLLEKALGTARFSYTLAILQDSVQVKQAFGYQAAFGKSDFVELKMRCNPQSGSEVTPLFIPYAALKLKEGKQSLTISADLTGKDGFNATYKQNTRSAVFTFEKPITKIFECSLDSLIVKPFDNNGQAGTMNYSEPMLPIWISPLKWEIWK
ncbi:hypothetical protein [Fluviicola sp.]|uniref:hypothetical protein n=1 Tax=Fluviicola sp. TaxID=1917219 RepID=UPI003D2A86EA